MAATVMVSVGAHLRELRMRRGVSLEEIARTTRVAQRYLESLEADAYDELPAPVFIRGFIRAYCQALGESPESALACYDAREGREPPAPRPAPLPRAGAAEPRARGAVVVSLVLLVVLGMALFTVALVLQPREPGQRSTPEGSPAPASSPADVSSETTAETPRTATAPPPAATAVAPAPGASPTVPARQPPVPPPTPEPAAVPAVASPAPSASSVPSRIPGLDALTGLAAPYRLIARVSDPTWIRVRTDDGRTSEETVPAGEVREWVSERPFVVTIGNAGGVALELNGQLLPPLGARGSVIPRLVLPPEAR